MSKSLAARFPEVVARVYPLELGPPVGWPVKYRVSGPDPQRVRAIALQVADLLGATTGVRNVNFDWVEPARVMRIRIDQDQARQLGLSSQDVALALNGVVTGTTVTQVRDSIYLIDVVARAEQTQRTSLESLRSLQIPLPSGRVVPLRQIATFEYDQEYPIVWRRNRVPTLTVQADVVPGVLPATAVQAVQPHIDKLAATLPSGYRIATGGSVEESGKAKASVLAVVPAMMLLVLTILIFQLQSFQRVLLVLSVAPLGLIGVVAALLLAQAPLGFVAILGVLALGGMIARNSVILIDQIEHERAAGTASVGRGRHRRDPPDPSHPAHRVRRHARHDPDRADSLLGTDGVRDHRRSGRGDGADPDLPARPVRRLVPDRGTCSRHRASRAGRGSGACLRGEYGSPHIRIRKGNVMTQASEDLSVAKLFAEREERRRRDQEAAERFQRRKEEELAAYKQRLDNVHLVDEMIPAQLERLKHAFERGESDLMVASFPCDFCTDGGRAVINAGEPPINKPTKEEEARQAEQPDWLLTMPAGIRRAHEYWKQHLQQGGFGFTARVISYPGGKPGDIGVFITWPKSPAEA